MFFDDFWDVVSLYFIFDDKGKIIGVRGVGGIYGVLLGGYLFDVVRRGVLVVFWEFVFGLICVWVFL